jgi:hypothetical protein
LFLLAIVLLLTDITATIFLRLIVVFADHPFLCQGESSRESFSQSSDLYQKWVLAGTNQTYLTFNLDFTTFFLILKILNLGAFGL